MKAAEEIGVSIVYGPLNRGLASGRCALNFIYKYSGFENLV